MPHFTRFPLWLSVALLVAVTRASEPTQAANQEDAVPTAELMVMWPPRLSVLTLPAKWFNWTALASPSDSPLTTDPSTTSTRRLQGTPTSPSDSEDDLLPRWQGWVDRIRGITTNGNNSSSPTTTTTTTPPATSRDQTNSPPWVPGDGQVLEAIRKNGLGRNDGVPGPLTSLPYPRASPALDRAAVPPTTKDAPPTTTNTTTTTTTTNKPASPSSTNATTTTTKTTPTKPEKKGDKAVNDPKLRGTTGKHRMMKAATTSTTGTSALATALAQKNHQKPPAAATTQKKQEEIVVKVPTTTTTTTNTTSPPLIDGPQPERSSLGKALTDRQPLLKRTKDQKATTTTTTTTTTKKKPLEQVRKNVSNKVHNLGNKKQQQGNKVATSITTTTNKQEEAGQPRQGRIQLRRERPITQREWMRVNKQQKASGKEGK